MSWILSLSTRTKLLFGFGLMLLFLAGVIAAAYFSIQSIKEDLLCLYKKDFAAAVSLAQIHGDINRQRSRMQELLSLARRSEQNAANWDMQEREREIETSLQEIFGSGQTDPRFVNRLENLRRALNAFKKIRMEQVALILDGKVEQAKQLDEGVQNEHYKTIQHLALELANEAEARASAATTQSMENAQKSIRIFKIAGGVALTLGIVLALFLECIIANPLKQVSEVARRIAAGDLTVNMPLSSRTDEVGILIRSFRKMVENLQSVLREIQESMDVLASSASDILASSSKVTAEALETDVIVVKTTTTAAGIRQTARLATEKAQYVSGSTQKAAKALQSSKQSVEEAVKGMNQICHHMASIAENASKLGERSLALNEILVAMNKLAEQCGVLALTSSVEAAKAGNHGKGFAVVAREMKQWSERSKQVAGQAQTILGEIQKVTKAVALATEHGGTVVETGVKQSAAADEAMRMLADRSIMESAHAANQMTTSSQQQLEGMEQMTVAMENIKQASAQNVAAMKQSEAAVQKLHELSRKLQQLAQRYRV